MIKKTALITGISGQDGSLLTDLLLNNDYKVFGLVRPTSNIDNISHLLHNKNLNLIYGDLMNEDLLRYLLSSNQIDEIYNLASQSNVRLSYEHPRQTFEVTLMGTISLIESVKDYSPKTKIFQAGSSAMFGNSCDEDGYQREETSFNPISPYASSKLFAHNICQNYRRNQGLHIVNGILYNHESSKNKRSQGIIKTIAEKAVLVKNKKINNFFIPDVTIQIDFTHAKDCVNAMWTSMQQEVSDDYIIASGTVYSIEYICDYIFKSLDLDYKEYITSETQVQKNNFISKGDPSKIKNIGWVSKFTFQQLMDEVIEFEINKSN